MDSELRTDTRLYLQFLQNTITRMSDNSKMCKQYSLSILTAWIVFTRLALSANHPINILINLLICLPTIVFWFLDGWYLLFERRYRNKYNSYVNLFTDKIKENKNSDEYKELIETLYNLNPMSNDSNSDNTDYLNILRSRSVFWTYFTQVIVIIAMAFVK